MQSRFDLIPRSRENYGSSIVVLSFTDRFGRSATPPNWHGPRRLSDRSSCRAQQLPLSHPPREASRARPPTAGVLVS
jgi:hypothetical protein